MNTREISAWGLTEISFWVGGKRGRADSAPACVPFPGARLKDGKGCRYWRE
jgi:hypothetical protein